MRYIKSLFLENYFLCSWGSQGHAACGGYAPLDCPSYTGWLNFAKGGFYIFSFQYIYLIHSCNDMGTQVTFKLRQQSKSRLITIVLDNYGGKVFQNC